MGTFALSQLPRTGRHPLDGSGKQVLIRIRVGRNDCRYLETQIGGSCQGTAKPPLHRPERLIVRSEDLPVIARITTNTGASLDLGQRGRGKGAGVPEDWSLSSDAGRTEVTISCPRDTPLVIDLLPGQSSPTCSPGATLYQLLIVNRVPYPPLLSLNKARTMEGGVDVRHAAALIERGTLTLGSKEREVSGYTPVNMTAANGRPFHLRLTMPPPNEAPAVFLNSPGAIAVSDGGTDVIPSELDRDSTRKTILIALIIGFSTTLILNLTIALARRWSSGKDASLCS